MFYRNWRKTTDGQNIISKALSVKTWDDNANEDDTLYNIKAEKWVKVVKSEDVQCRLIGNDIV